MDSENIVFYSFDENMRLIDLAFDCVFINTSEREKAIKILNEIIKENEEVNITHIFKEEAFVSDKRIEKLLALDEHLKIHQRDQQFGKLAIANGLASEEEVYNALNYQKNYFKKQQINLNVGDILVENNIMTAAGRTSILLTQNRIKLENLSDALNNLGETQAEKDAINKRFGVLAIKNKLVNISQVNAALALQKNENHANGESRFIGEILKETASLSDDDIQCILLEQKQFEKRKLDLEKALYTVKTEIKISKKLNKLFECRLSNDGLEAYVTKLKKTEEDISVYEFLIWLRRVGVKSGIVDDAILEEFIKTADIKSKITVAKGYPAKQGIDERPQFYFENEFTRAYQESIKPSEDNSQFNDAESEKTGSEGSESDEPESDPAPSESNADEEKSKEQDQTEKTPGDENPDDEKSDVETPEKENPKEENTEEENTEEISDEKSDTPVTSKEIDPDGEDLESNTGMNNKENGKDKEFLIRKGSLLARIIPGKKGKPGKDVLGYPIKPLKPALCWLNAGGGVMRKGPVFRAKISGRPIISNGTTLMVKPVDTKAEVKKLNSNIGNDTQDMYETAIVKLKGRVSAGAILRCHSLMLNGPLKGRVICTGEMEVNGEIGMDEAPKDIGIFQTEIMCKGSIRAFKSITNSKIQTEDELFAYNSTITGSEIVAYKGMTIKDCVNNKTTPTILWFGLKPGDKILIADSTISMRNKELSVLKKEEDMAELTEKYIRDKKEEEIHQLEQIIYKNLVEIIQAPELDQHEGLEAKIKYLFGLPAFSSVKAYYLKIPETDDALAFLDQLLIAVRKMSQDNAIKFFKNKIEAEPEPGNEGDNEPEEPESNMYRIEADYKARLAAFEQEISDKSEEIGKIENEIQGLQTLRSKLGLVHIKSLSQSMAMIKIKNKCEKGTIIKGKIAQLVVEETLYNVKFKEVVSPLTNAVSIAIDA